MKIVFLNTWNGEIKDGITEFIRNQALDTDIFCFQEVYPEMRQLARSILSDYEEFYAYKEISGDDFTQATYVNKKIKVIETGEVLDAQTDCGLGVNIKITFGNKIIQICNFHGCCQPGDKLDTPARLRQSIGLIEYFKDKKGLKIIGGDFNMLPDTESIRMFANNGYRDLIREFDVKTTRNRVAWEMYPNNPQYHADYIFLSPEIRMKNFSVVNNEVSDHLPLILEIEE